MAYREDHEAALARADALAEELAEAKRAHAAEVAELKSEIAALRRRKAPTVEARSTPARPRKPSSREESLHAPREKPPSQPVALPAAGAVALAAFVGALVYGLTHGWH